MTLSGALQHAVSELNTISETPKLDAEILLAHVLQVSRSYFYAWPEKEISPEAWKIFSALTARRKNNEPVAYLTGHKEFWSLDFLVTKDVLIPRPDTELLVETVLEIFSEKNKLTLADLGTGSGVIALAIANEKKDWQIHATDISQAALTVARENAKQLNISNVNFHAGNWVQALPKNILFDVIVSNPPYIDRGDLTQELQYEPRSALISADNGLSDIQQIITEAKSFLAPNGLLLIEHGADQGLAVRNIFTKQRYNEVITRTDLAGKERVTGGYTFHDTYN